MNLPKRIVKKLFSVGGYEVVRKGEVEKFASIPPEVKLYLALPPEKRALIAPFMAHSKAQLAQDLFVLSELGRNPDDAHFFVEFGATDGVSFSNTHLLEKELGWTGVLAEPARVWHGALRANRSCLIDFRCVSASSGEVVKFVEVAEADGGVPELSSVLEYADSGDKFAAVRMASKNVYDVETVSLSDLLDACSAPSVVSYLSVDTEGSELAILRAFDFSRYQFRVITVEHNYRPEIRQGLYELLVGHGYQRKYEDLSLWDDWYVLPG